MSATAPVAVIGAGPVGLSAAAHLASRGIDFVLLEAGAQVGAAMAEWGHVRLFSPWRFDTDPVARELLESTGWTAPDPDLLPTGADLISHYLAPLAALPQIAGSLRLNSAVTAISRVGFDRVRTAGREDAPFLLRLASGEEITARAVIDASGVWRTPNPLGGNGLPAYGESEAAERISIGMPDVLGAERKRFAGRHTVVIGAGHSASGTLLALAELAEQVPGTSITWAVRAANPSRAFGGGDADALPARGAIGTRVRELVEAGRLTVLTGFSVYAVGADGTVTAADGRTVAADVIVNSTGARPDHGIATELRLDLDPILGSTRALAPLIDPNQHSCGTVPPHGVDELGHPEPGFYDVGVKSYGRAPTFLLATGYEQARSVVAALAGDWEAARDVKLDLPETGVCSSSAALGQDEGDSCCGTPASVEKIAQPVGAGRGLATGISGGLLSVPLVDVSTKSGGGCCG